MKEIVIWAHSECRSTMSLYREVKRQVGVPVTIALWQYGADAVIRTRRETTGQGKGEYDDLAPVPVGEDLARGEELLAMHSGEGAATRTPLCGGVSYCSPKNSAFASSSMPRLPARCA